MKYEIEKINDIADRLRRNEITEAEALTELNKVRAKIDLDPLEEMPLGWRKFTKSP
jgi:hypothetical protein